MRSRSLLASILLGTLALASCGGGGGGGGGVNADILIGDAPSDDLLSFTATVQSVRLQREDLSFTGDLVGALEVEFKGLNGTFAFLAKGRVPAGTYVAVEVGFAPGGYSARANDSSPVTIVAGADTYLAALPAPLVVASGAYVRFAIDLDLLNSLSGNVANGTLDFSPSGSCDSNDGSEDAPIDELKGTVAAKNETARTLSVDGFAGNPPVSLGRVSVHVGDTAVLFDNDNQVLTVSAFFAALVPGTTLVEVHGNLAAGGVVEATRIEIEDAIGSGGDAVVRIRGLVGTVGAQQFTLQIAQIKDGADVAEPVLATLKNPDLIDVAFGAGTTFLFDSGALTDSGSLAPGQEVKVRFSDFSQPPFPASEVEIDDTPGFRGVLVDPTAPAGGLAMRLDADDPAILAGLVADAHTAVRVEAASAAIVLDVPGAPILAARELVPGLELAPRGRLSGTPEAPVLAAERVWVRPGFLRAAAVASVSSVDAVVDGGEFVDPFGLSVTPGPIAVRFEDECCFEGAVDSRAAFLELVRQRAGTPLAIDVRGIAGAIPNEVRAFVVRVLSD